MQVSGNTIRITGGSAGIGFALAEAFSNDANRVIVCGRRESKLREAKQRLPSLHTIVCDVSVKSERENLFRSVSREFSPVNVLINNAGIQRETDFLKGAPELTDGESEIETNLTASVHLCALFVPYFSKLDGRLRGRKRHLRARLRPIDVLADLLCDKSRIAFVFDVVAITTRKYERSSVRAHSPPRANRASSDGIVAQAGREAGITPARVAEKFVAAFEKDRFEAAIGEGADLRAASRLAPHFFHRMLNKLAVK